MFVLKFIWQYIVNLLLVLDKVLSSILGGNGSDTISTRLGYAKPTCPICRGICAVLSFLFGKDHCARAADPSIPSIGKELWDWGNDPK